MNNYNSNWKKLFGFRNPQEKLENVIYCLYQLSCKQLVALASKYSNQIQSKLLPEFAKCCFSGKLTRHKVGCDKRFKEPKNQEPPHDWEPPAKIPKPINYASRVNPGASLLNRQHHQNTAILNQAARGALQVTILFNLTLGGKICDPHIL